MAEQSNATISFDQLSAYGKAMGEAMGDKIGKSLSPKRDKKDVYSINPYDATIEDWDSLIRTLRSVAGPSLGTGDEFHNIYFSQPAFNYTIDDKEFSWLKAGYALVVPWAAWDGFYYAGKKEVEGMKGAFEQEMYGTDVKGNPVMLSAANYWTQTGNWPEDKREDTPYLQEAEIYNELGMPNEAAVALVKAYIRAPDDETRRTYRDMADDLVYDMSLEESQASGSPGAGNSSVTIEQLNDALDEVAEGFEGLYERIRYDNQLDEMDEVRGAYRA